MGKTIKYLLIGVMVIGSGSIAYGAGNTSSGKTKSAACAGCHGKDGNSMVPTFPRLAGQNAKYLNRQLFDFKNQKRTDATMQAMAMGLSEQDIADLSAYYAGKAPKFTRAEGEQYLDDDEKVPITKQMMAAGKQVYVAGNEESGVAACSACHGLSGQGNAPAGFPELKGQFLPYLLKSLSDFKDGVRTNDEGGVMQSIAAKMSKDEINAVSAYLSNLQ